MRPHRPTRLEGNAATAANPLPYQRARHLPRGTVLGFATLASVVLGCSSAASTPSVSGGGDSAGTGEPTSTTQDAGRVSSDDAHAATGIDAPLPDAAVALPDAAVSLPDAAQVAADAPDASEDDAARTASKDPCHPFTLPTTDALFSSTKRVFAHYFYPFPLSIDNAPSATDYYNRNYLTPSGESNAHKAEGGFLRQRPLPVPVSTSATWKIDNMKSEVRMAIAAGITGFTFDAMNANLADAGSQLQDLLTAAAAVDPRFKIMIMPDLAALGANASAVEAIISSVATNPAAYRLADGRLAVTSFEAETGSVDFWKGVFADLTPADTKVAFVPTFLGWSTYASTYAPISYGLSDWGTATPSASTSAQSWPAEAHAMGQIFMMPVGSQQYRPKDFLYWESENSLAFRDAWTSAIAGDSDWVQVVTWSDFSESAEIEPYTDATLSPTIGTGFHDLNSYYAAWFATGHAPAITEDGLFYFYRREPVGAAAPAQTTATKPVLAGGGPGQDSIELLGFVTAPGTLSITINGKTSTMNAPAGLTSFTVPLEPGTPTFALERAGKDVVSFQGGVQIYGEAGLPSGTLDLTYWSGSASASGTCSLTVPAP